MTKEMTYITMADLHRYKDACRLAVIAGALFALVLAYLAGAAAVEHEFRSMAGLFGFIALTGALVGIHMTLELRLMKRRITHTL
jgi:hypothetical protein